MERAGTILVATLDLLEGRIRSGVSTAELDRVAERFIRSRGAAPTFKGYRGFPGSRSAPRRTRWSYTGSPAPTD